LKIIPKASSRPGPQGWEAAVHEIAELFDPVAELAFEAPVSTGASIDWWCRRRIVGCPSGALKKIIDAGRDALID
jgi:hypothetical protein